eukprot:6448038-Pyramimonas_sp.AAC.1
MQNLRLVFRAPILGLVEGPLEPQLDHPVVDCPADVRVEHVVIRSKLRGLCAPELHGRRRGRRREPLGG